MTPLITVINNLVARWRYRYRKFLQRFLAALLASLFINFVPGFFSPVPALVEDAPSYTKPVLQILKEGLVTTAEEAEADPELLPVLDNPFVIVGLVAINVGVAWYFYSQAQQLAAQQLAQQKYCAANPTDLLCSYALYQITSVDLVTGQTNPQIWYGPINQIIDCGQTYDCSTFPYYNPYHYKIGMYHAANNVFDGLYFSYTNPGKIASIIPQGNPVTPWSQWPQDKRNAAVGMLTDDDWISNLQQSPQGEVFQKGDQLPKGYFAFPPDGPPQHIPGPVDVPDNSPNPNPEPSPSPSPDPSPNPSPGDPPPPSPSPSDSPSPSPAPSPGDPSPSPTSDPSPSSSPPTASGGDDSSSSSDPSSSPSEGSGSSSPEPYVNNNPNATDDENRIGELLDHKAQSGELSGVNRVQGAAETPGSGRSGDYRFINSDGSQTSADLYQPQSGNVNSIGQNIIAKGDQAQTVVVELGAGSSGGIGADEARSMAEDVVNTPDQGVNRVIVIKDSQIIVDVSR